MMQRESYSAFTAGLLMDRWHSISSTPMPRTAPTCTPLEWRELAHACQVVAAKERARAAEIAGPDARGFVVSAETFERLAERCLEMTRPAYE